MASLLGSIPGNSSNESGRSSLAIPIPPGINGDASSKVETETTEPIREEWPSLPNVSGRKKSREDRPLQVATVEISSKLPSMSSAVQTPVTMTQSVAAVSAKSEAKSSAEVPDERVSFDDYKPTIAKTVQDLDHTQTAEETSPVHSNLDQTESIKDAANPSPGAEVETATASQSENVLAKIPPAVSAATRPLTPSVRLSPAPSGDSKMTIVVDYLSPKEPEEDIKLRFRQYGRVVSFRLQTVPYILTSRVSG